MYRRKRLYQYVIWGGTALIILQMIILIWLARPLKEESGVKNNCRAEYLIAHAGGGLDGKTYTNSKKALITSLERGFRYIELDLFQLNNGQVVCAHDSSKCQLDSIMTLNDAIEIWNRRPFFFVTDRISDPSILNRYFIKNRNNIYVETGSMVEYCHLFDNGYNPMLTVAGDFRGVIKSLIASLYCGKMIKRVVTHYSAHDYILRIYKRLGFKTAVYTINEEPYLKKHIGKDVDMVYTDFLIPDIH